MSRASLILLFLCLNGFPADRVLVHGHRGARALLPENTLPAFEYAMDEGADVLELDLAVTKDNVLVVSHDPMPNPVVCNRGPVETPIRKLTLAQVKQFDCGSSNPAYPEQKAVPGTRIPTLDEVLEMAKGSKVEFNVETKVYRNNPELTPAPGEFARLVLNALKRHGVESRTILQSFDFRTLHAMKKLDPAVRLSALYQGPPKSFVEIAEQAGATIVSPHHTLVTKQRVAEAHQAGLQVVPWTANAPEDWRPLVEAGVDAIITDNPAALISYLKQPRGR